LSVTMSGNNDVYDSGSFNKTSLEAQARSTIASSIRVLTDAGSNDNGKDPTHKKFIFPAPCSGVDDAEDETTDHAEMAESTTTLLAARTLSKLGRSDLSWEFLRTLFAAQGEDGLMPRYVYFTDNDGLSGWKDYFLGPFPGPQLFIELSGENASQQKDQSSRIKMGSSSTIMAPPHHATSILETFYLSNQTKTDLYFLGECFAKLNRWHSFLHDHVSRNCTISSDVTGGNESLSFPCLPIQHPWETEIDLTSPIWRHALKNVTNSMKEIDWVPSFEIPSPVKQSFDYPGDDEYYTLLYLLYDQSQNNVSDGAQEKNRQKHRRRKIYSSNMLFSPQFAMLDVGFIAALSKSDRDMLQIAKILVDKNYVPPPTWEVMESLAVRSRRSQEMLHRLWDQRRGAFFNRVVLAKNRTDENYGNLTVSITLDVAVGYNFAAFWDQLSNKTMTENIASQLLHHTGNFSFLCDDFPLWSVGCDEVRKNESFAPFMLPLLNYRVSNGLKRNNEAGLGYFIQTSTVNLLCGLSNSQDSTLEECQEQVHFARAFNASTHLPLGSESTCDVSSTLTAAIALEIILPDKAFRYEPEPPISNSSVIFLIAVEMVVAFGIGISCLLLSLNLVRRISSDEEGNDAFIQSVREEEPLQVSDLYGENTLIDNEIRSPSASPFELSNSDAGGKFEVFAWTLSVLSRLNPWSMLGKRRSCLERE